jgi:hypothetical protein
LISNVLIKINGCFSFLAMKPNSKIIVWVPKLHENLFVQTSYSIIWHKKWGLDSVSSQFYKNVGMSALHFLLFLKVDRITPLTKSNAKVCIRKVFYAIFLNISAIWWRSVLLLVEAWVHGENHRPVASHWQALWNKVESSTPRHERDSNSLLYWW